MPKYLAGKQRAMLEGKQTPPAKFKPRAKKSVKSKKPDTGLMDMVMKMAPMMASMVPSGGGADAPETGMGAMKVRSTTPGADPDTTIPMGGGGIGPATGPGVRGAPGSIPQVPQIQQVQLAPPAPPAPVGTVKPPKSELTPSSPPRHKHHEGINPDAQTLAYMEEEKKKRMLAAIDKKMRQSYH